MAESENLLACPFCGNQHPELLETHKNHWRVGCAKCGSYNNNALGRDAALKAWNERAGGPERGATDGKAVGCSAWLEELYARFQHLDAVFRMVSAESTDPFHKAAKDMWLAISDAARGSSSNAKLTHSAPIGGGNEPKAKLEEKR